MEISRIKHAEGGILSGNRVYLRMIRERLAFDTCAAPFGTGYFFSCRTVHSPPVVKLWHVLAALTFFVAIFGMLFQPFGPYYSGVAVTTLALAIAQVFRNAIALGLHDLDAMLMKSPVVGPIYERWFRKDTYYRQDTRLMYLDTIPKIVQVLAEEITAAKGVKLARQYQLAPVLGELYKPVLPQEKTTRV